MSFVSSSSRSEQQYLWKIGRTRTFGLLAAAVAIALVSPEYASAPGTAEVSYLCKIGCMSIPQRQQQPQQTSYVWKIGRMNLYT